MVTRNATSWREFEKLVARIESALVPTGAAVKSPDLIRDKNTGNLREVDASIRCQIGSSPVLITIECRDRSGTQDVTWVEQVSSKQQAIGADKTILVSSSGFTTQAIETANRLGLLIRVTREIDKNEIIAWCQLNELSFFLREYTIIELNLNIDRESETDSSDVKNSILKEYRKNNLDAHIAWCIHDDRPLSARMLVMHSFNQMTEDKTIDTWVHEKPDHQTIRVDFPSRDYYTRTIDGRRTLLSVRIQLAFKYEEAIVDTKSLPIVEYSSPDCAIAHSMSVPLNLAQGAHRVDLIHDTATRLTKFQFRGPVFDGDKDV